MTAMLEEGSQKKHLLDVKGMGRDKSMADYTYFLDNRVSPILTELKEGLPSAAAVRVVCVRHGMGHHNDAFEVRPIGTLPSHGFHCTNLCGSIQVASFMNRDAELNRVGIYQVARSGELLRTAGVFGPNTLTVVSPMRRTLQTTLGLFGADQASDGQMSARIGSARIGWVLLEWIRLD